jgi:hypothetical protein
MREREREISLPSSISNLCLSQSQNTLEKECGIVQLDELIFGFCLQGKGLKGTDRASMVTYKGKHLSEFWSLV